MLASGELMNLSKSSFIWAKGVLLILKSLRENPSKKVIRSML